MYIGISGGFSAMVKKVSKKPKTPKTPKAKKKRLSKFKSLNPKLQKVITVLLSLAFTALLCVCVVTVYLFNFASSYVNGEPKINIDEYKENQAQTTIVYAYNNNDEVEEIARLHGEQNRVWVSIDSIPEILQKAYVDLEDKRFEKHGGVDWVRTVKTVLTLGKSGGGSTLTQQLIKNLTGDNAYTINRKFYEILNALNLEKNASKSTILEAYLNTVYLGNGCYGVKTAAEKYFGKELSELNYAECACLAGITKNPSKFEPLKHAEDNRKRQIDCLWYMHEAGDITDEEYEQAKAYEMVFTNSENYVKSESAAQQEAQTQTVEINSYYVDYVIKSVIDDLVNQLGYTRSQASKLIYNGGLRIYSAIDRNVQSQLEDVYVNRISMPAYNQNVPDAQSAMTIMDYSGRILGIVGGTGPKTENRGLNRATSPRQPGSSIKPLSVYTAAINEKHVTWGTKVMNYGFMVGGKLWPQNYGGDMGSPDSYITVQLALAVSYNTVPAQLVRQMGMNTCYKYAKEKFHLSTLTDNDIAYAPMAVGGLTYGVTTVDMAAAFASFGNGGKYYKPYCYYKVTNANGSKIYLQNGDEEGEQIMTQDSADVMNRLLQTVVTDAAHASTGRKYGVSGFQTFAKTGTTTDDKDRWFVGGTPYYVAAVWYGCDQPKQLSKYVTGNPSGAIFQEVMNRIHKGLAAKNFEVYSPLTTQATYCLRSGLLASESCPEKATGWYSKSNMPGRCVSCAAEAAPVENPEETVTIHQQVTPAEPTPAPTPPATTAPAATTPPAPEPTEPAVQPNPEG